MLRISKLADYATVVMVYLARHPETLHAARDVAGATHLGLPTVSKLLKRLAAAGLVQSVRGAHGGYRLKTAAEKISIVHILYALEEQQGLTACSIASDCSLIAHCAIQGNWRLISEAISQALASVSLAALAEPVLAPEVVQRIHHLARPLKGCGTAGER